jgi:uncharacterized beta barrel domain-containing protein DUF5777
MMRLLPGTGTVVPGILMVCALAVAIPAGAQTPAGDPSSGLTSTPQTQAPAPTDPKAQPPATPDPNAQAQNQSAQPPAAPEPRNDARLDPLQPDFSLAALPVTLRLPAHKMSFRVTHRFNQSLGAGTFSDQLQSLFGIDTGAKIGLELRYGVRPGTQVGLHRTSDRTIELFGQQSIFTQGTDKPLSLDAIVTLEGQNNLRAQKSPTIGVLASRKVAKVAAVYAEPLFVFNTNPISGQSQKNTFMLGLGARVRIRPSAYVVGEVTPRFAGYTPGVSQASFGIEGRVGGHLFQLNFSNGQGTTLGQLARGGVSSHFWVLGFNIARKFF